MKYKHMLILICLSFINTTSGTLVNDINDLKTEAFKAIGSSAKLILTLYTSTYFCVLAHEYGHAFSYKLLFPNRKLPKIIIGPHYYFSPYPRITLFNGHLVLGRNILKGGITIPEIDFNKDALEYPKSNLIVSLAGPLTGTLTSIIGHKLITCFLRKYSPNIAESLRLSLACSLLLNIGANISSLVPFRGSDGYYIKQIIKYMCSKDPKHLSA